MLTILKAHCNKFLSSKYEYQEGNYRIFKTGLTRLEWIKLIVGQRIWRYLPLLYY